MWMTLCQVVTLHFDLVSWKPLMIMLLKGIAAHLSGRQYAARRPA